MKSHISGRVLWVSWMHLILIWLGRSTEALSHFNCIPSVTELWAIKRWIFRLFRQFIIEGICHAVRDLSAEPMKSHENASSKDRCAPLWCARYSTSCWRTWCYFTKIPVNRPTIWTVCIEHAWQTTRIQHVNKRTSNLQETLLFIWFTLSSQINSACVRTNERWFMDQIDKQNRTAHL